MQNEWATVMADTLAVAAAAGDIAGYAPVSAIPAPIRGAA